MGTAFRSGRILTRLLVIFWDLQTILGRLGFLGFNLQGIHLIVQWKSAMEVCGKSILGRPANVIYISTILGRDGPASVHKCDWKCQNEHVWGNVYYCKLTGLTHICDKNCDQRILYDNHSCLCLASGKIFPLSHAEEQAVRGVRRKLEAENSLPTESCNFKRRRDSQRHPSPFEKSFSAVSPICSPVGDGMDMS